MPTKLQKLRHRAEHGDAEAQYELAEVYYYGRNVRSSPRTALSWMRRAAKGSHPGANFWLACLYDYGLTDSSGRIILRKNRKYAFHYYEIAASLGDTSAQINLGGLLDTGTVGPPDRKRAMALFKRAFRLGDKAGASNVALTHMENGKRSLAVKWWKRAAQSGYFNEDFVELAYCYQYGIGVRKDIAQSRRYYRTAIRSEIITEYRRDEANYHLALLELDTKGPNKKVTRLLETAAKDRDYPQALQFLNAIKAGKCPEPCRCRRFNYPAYRSYRACRVHPQGREPNR